MKKINFFLSLTLIFSFVVIEVLAGYRPSFGGEYTNICGSGTDANFYSCPASCNINEGWCEARQDKQEWIYVFVCDGRQIECRSNMQGPLKGKIYLTSYASPNSNKTVQIDVFNKICTSGGGWSCTDQNLLGYLVWYSGSGGGGGGDQIQCNTGQVVLRVIPDPSNVGNRVKFRIAAGDASTWWENIFSGGVGNCTETNYGWETECTAQTPGTFTWTRKWKHCVGDFNNCSDWCYKSISFTINSAINPPTVITLPPVVTL